jgi:hypothetical protein
MFRLLGWFAIVLPECSDGISWGCILGEECRFHLTVSEGFVLPMSALSLADGISHIADPRVSRELHQAL